jgi:hypothetical protein
MVNTVNMLKYFYNLILLAITIIPLQAQDISFTATAPETVKLGEQFRIEYEINDRVKDFTPPQFSDFIYLSSQQGISTINWKTTQQYVYIFKATQLGVFKVAPAKAKFKGKTIESNELEIEVVASTQTSKTNTQQSTPQIASPTSSGEDVFVRLILDKQNSFVGEPIIAYIKVYTKLQLSGIDNNFHGPDFTGFYVQNITIPPLRSLEPEKVGEITYYTGLIRKMILIPQKSGKLVIEPFEMVVQQDKKVKVGYFTTYQTQNVSLTSNSAAVKVKPLPANQPAGFAGAIGEFDVKATMSTNKVNVNDAVVFKVSVSGNGNIKLIDNIDYNLPSAFDVFDPVIKTKISESGLSGSKIFEITAIPRHAGEFVIKPFELVYFNPKSEQYITKKTESFLVHVEKNSNDSSQVLVSNLSREDVKLLESDIRYIKTDTNLVKSNLYIIDSIVYYLLFVIGLFLFILILFLRREQIKRSADKARTRHKKASRMANKRLKIARKFVTENNNTAFYAELSKALWGYISDKLGIPRSELSAELAGEKFSSRNIDKAILEELLALINTCEFARYAPGNVEKLPNELLKSAFSLLTKIEQNFH